jgi:biopolymer transport protein ExbD
MDFSTLLTAIEVVRITENTATFGNGDVVNVINEARKAGVDKIGLVADKKKKEGNKTPTGVVES